MPRTAHDVLRDICVALPELEELALDSYRHFALKRMLKALG